MRSHIATTSNQQTSDLQIRIARVGDAEAVRAIYAPFCEPTSAVSFEMMPPSIEEMARRIEATTKFYPWLVCEDAGHVLAFAYAGAFHTREAYQWSVTSSIYVDSGARRRGVGKLLYQRLFDLLRQQGFINVYAGITLPNPGSESLHRHCGFEHVATYQSVGFKVGRWQDVAWYRLLLGDHSLQPVPPSPITAIV